MNLITTSSLIPMFFSQHFSLEFFQTFKNVSKLYNKYALHLHSPVNVCFMHVHEHVYVCMYDTNTCNILNMLLLKYRACISINYKIINTIIYILHTFYMDSLEVDSKNHVNLVVNNSLWIFYEQRLFLIQHNYHT